MSAQLFSASTLGAVIFSNAGIGTGTSPPSWDAILSCLLNERWFPLLTNTPCLCVGFNWFPLWLKLLTLSRRGMLTWPLGLIPFLLLNWFCWLKLIWLLDSWSNTSLNWLFWLNTFWLPTCWWLSSTFWRLWRHCWFWRHCSWLSSTFCWLNAIWLSWLSSFRLLGCWWLNPWLEGACGGDGRAASDLPSLLYTGGATAADSS